MNRLRTAAWLLMIMLAAVLGGCFLFDSPEPAIHAVIAPEQGIVPYTAQIVATAPEGGLFTFALPDATIIQESSVLEVLVDNLSWSATITWTEGDVEISTTVTATGSNERPTINRPLVNGIASQWFLKPRERTLIDFAYRPATMTSPTTGVFYNEEWSIHEISVMCSKKLLCNQPIRDSIYCPPYETGTYHARFNGTLYESACIVYPTSTYEPSARGIPYAPAPEDGYSYDTIQNRSVFKQVSFPAQTAIIRVVVRDNFGRLTSKEFEIPVLAFAYSTDDKSGDPQSFDEANYLVASKNEPIFHQSWCPETCNIPESLRIYFADRRHAEESGRSIDPACSVMQPAP